MRSTEQGSRTVPMGVAATMQESATLLRQSLPDADGGIVVLPHPHADWSLSLVWGERVRAPSAGAAAVVWGLWLEQAEGRGALVARLPGAGAEQVCLFLDSAGGVPYWGRGLANAVALAVQQSCLQAMAVEEALTYEASRWRKGVWAAVHGYNNVAMGLQLQRERLQRNGQAMPASVADLHHLERLAHLTGQLAAASGGELPPSLPFLALVGRARVQLLAAGRGPDLLIDEGDAPHVPLPAGVGDSLLVPVLKLLAAWAGPEGVVWLTSLRSPDGAVGLRLEANRYAGGPGGEVSPLSAAAEAELAQVGRLLFYHGGSLTRESLAEGHGVTLWVRPWAAVRERQPLWGSVYLSEC